MVDDKFGEVRPTRSGPIFVVGAPRTGTTLTMEVLNNHSLVHLYDEVHYNERIADTMPANGALGQSGLRRAAIRLLERSPWKKGTDAGNVSVDDLVGAAEPLGGDHAAVLKAFLVGEAAAHGKTIWGDSSPQDVLYLDRLKAWYPGARVVGVVRDPRGFLASYKNYYRKELKSYRNRFNPLTNSLLWRSYMRALRSAQASAFARDVYLLKYEDLVSAPESQVRSLSDFLEIGFEESMLAVGRQNSSYHKVSEDRQNTGIKAGSRDRWASELSNAEIWLVQRICDQELRHFGYEPVPVRLGPGDLGALLKIMLLLPGRLYNLLFRTGKPFTASKLKRVLGRTT